MYHLEADGTGLPVPPWSIDRSALELQRAPPDDDRGPILVIPWLEVLQRGIEEQATRKESPGCEAEPNLCFWRHVRLPSLTADAVLPARKSCALYNNAAECCTEHAIPEQAIVTTARS